MNSYNDKYDSMMRSSTPMNPQLQSQMLHSTTMSTGKSKRQRPTAGGAIQRCKRRSEFKADFSNYQHPGPQAAQVTRRNERERNRVKQVNMGFVKLREHVPNGIKNKKMSKVETLKSAVDYIRAMQSVLEEQERGFSLELAGMSTNAIKQEDDPQESADNDCFASASAALMQMTNFAAFSGSDGASDNIFNSSSCGSPDSGECDFMKTEDDYLWFDQIHNQ